MLLSVESEDVSPAKSSLVGFARNDNSCSRLEIELVLADVSPSFSSPSFSSPSLFSRKVMASGQGLPLLVPTSAERMRLQ